MKADSPERAAEAFRRSLRIREDASVSNDLGAALEMLGPSRDEQAEACFRRAVQLKPADVEYRYNLGRFLVDHDRPREGAEDLRNLLDDKPDHARAWDRLGVAEFALGQDDAGLECLRRAVQIDPNLGTAQADLAVAMLNKGLYAELVPHAEQAVRLRPEVPLVHNVLRSALVMLGRGGELTAFYRREATSQPDQPMIQYELGTCLAQAGQAAEAAEHLRKAGALRRSWPEALAELAMVLSAAADAKVRDGAEALRLARQACDLTGRRSARPLDALAAGLAETGQFDQAADAARQAAGLAKAGGDMVLSARISERLKLYEQRKPFRLPAGDGGIR
jgi:tetratricopeptide (TPR) repeat protein